MSYSDVTEPPQDRTGDASIGDLETVVDAYHAATREVAERAQKLLAWLGL